MAESIKLKNNRYWDVTAIHGLFDAIYPVGSIYLSVNNTNPGDMFGGTWVAYGDSNTYLRLGGNGSGGSNSVKLAANQIPSLTTGNQSANHTHSGTTGNNNVGHTHAYGSSLYCDSVSGTGSYLSFPQTGSKGWVMTSNAKTTAGQSANHTHTFTTGNNSANHTHTYTNNSQQNISVEPQYVQVYAWKRTA